MKLICFAKEKRIEINFSAITNALTIQTQMKSLKLVSAARSYMVRAHNLYIKLENIAF